jgi:hypothetical protein
MTKNIDLDPDSFGGEDFPPIVSAEEELAIKNFFNQNPTFKAKYVHNSTLLSYITGEDDYDPNSAWVQTYSGKRFNPTNPQMNAIVIQDIAHALSMQCRFSGHVKSFYSVAQHCVLVSHICNREDALHGLLHDASEAYLVDVPAPLKRSGKFDSYLEFEKNLQDLIYKRFGLDPVEPPSVKYADTKLLVTEARDLLAPLRPDWELPAKPLPFNITPLNPVEAKKLFLERFFELLGDCVFLEQNIDKL